MSESELAAAIWPYENGSSTIGVKKSTVCTSARWRSNRYTPASSNVFELTSTFRFSEMGSCGKTCRRACWLSFDAHPAQDESDVSFRICSRDMRFTSFEGVVPPTGRWLQCNRKSKIENRKLNGGEDRNRTYLATCAATTVLKTARATRHPSLSTEKTPNAQRPTSNVQPDELSVGRLKVLTAASQRRKLTPYFAFLIALTIWSKSGHSPDSSLEWSSLPLARISKAPPLEGISVSDLMRSPSSRILAAKLTAFGV